MVFSTFIVFGVGFIAGLAITTLAILVGLMIIKRMFVDNNNL
jgi:hypothetical protein